MAYFALGIGDSTETLISVSGGPVLNTKFVSRTVHHIITRLFYQVSSTLPMSSASTLSRNKCTFQMVSASVKCLCAGHVALLQEHLLTKYLSIVLCLYLLLSLRYLSRSVQRYRRVGQSPCTQKCAKGWVGFSRRVSAARRERRRQYTARHRSAPQKLVLVENLRKQLAALRHLVATMDYYPDKPLLGGC